MLFLCKSCKSQQQVSRVCLCSPCINVIAVALQWQPLVTRVVAGLLAASLPGPAEQAVSDMMSLGCSEPDINRTAQAAANLNVQQLYIHVLRPPALAQTGFSEQNGMGTRRTATGMSIRFWPSYKSMCVMAKAELLASPQDTNSTAHSMMHTFLLRESS